MKKLLLIFTFLLVFPLKAFASCEEFKTQTNILNTNGVVSYYNNNGENLTAVLSSPTLISNARSIAFLRKPTTIAIDTSYDYITMTGNWVFYSPAYYLENNQVLLRDYILQTMPAPYMYTSNDQSKMVFCSYSSTVLSDTVPSFINTSSVVNYSFYTFDYTITCPIHQAWSSSSSNYYLEWWLSYPTTGSTDAFVSLQSIGFFSYLRGSGVLSKGVCSNEQIIESIDSINDSITDLNDSITDTSTSNSQTELESQLEDWGVNYHGVAGFVTAPLSFISSLANQQACTPISLPPLFGNTTSTFVLPCFMEEFEDKFPSLFAIYEIAIYFFVCYRIGIDCFKLIQKLKDPLNDEISVADI